MQVPPTYAYSAPRVTPGLVRATSEVSSLDEPISAGICRQRDASFDAEESDPTMLSPQNAKRLKLYAKQLCNDLEIPEKSVLDFIEVI